MTQDEYLKEKVVLASALDALIEQGVELVQAKEAQEAIHVLAEKQARLEKEALRAAWFYGELRKLLPGAVVDVIEAEKRFQDNTRGSYFYLGILVDKWPVKFSLVDYGDHLQFESGHPFRVPDVLVSRPTIYDGEVYGGSVEADPREEKTYKTIVEAMGAARLRSWEAAEEDYENQELKARLEQQLEAQKAAAAAATPEPTYAPVDGEDQVQGLINLDELRAFIRRIVDEVLEERN